MHWRYFDFYHKLRFFKLIIILTNAPIEPITKNNHRKKQPGSKKKKSII